METHPVREAGSRCPLGDEEVGGDGDVGGDHEVGGDEEVGGDGDAGRDEEVITLGLCLAPTPAGSCQGEESFNPPTSICKLNQVTCQTCLIKLVNVCGRPSSSPRPLQPSSRRR